MVCAHGSTVNTPVNTPMPQVSRLGPWHYDHVLTIYAEQLDEQGNRLFCNESRTAVYIRQYDEAKNGVQDYLAVQEALKVVQTIPNN
jgi:hypothetical protein